MYSLLAGCCTAWFAVLRTQSLHHGRSRYGVEVRDNRLLCVSKTILKSEKSTERPRVQVDACKKKPYAHRATGPLLVSELVL